MAAQKKEQLINFLPQEEFAASTIGRILAWILSTFRFIVIITEMIVVLAFISRFWLDATLSDLNDKITEKSAVIVSYSSFEKNFREIQKKLKILEFLFGKEKALSNLLKKTTSYLPTDTVLESFSINAKNGEIKGKSTTEQEIAQFLVNLENLGSFNEVTLVQTSSRKDNPFISFTIKTLAKEN